MRTIDEIIVHCSATQPTWMQDEPAQAKVREIDNWHKSRGWNGIGYHHIIDRDGSVWPGRPLEQTGAHVKGKNTGTIGVCLIGGYGSNERDNFSQHYTPAQDNALRGYLADMQRQFPSIKRISGHNEYAAKACPGFYVPSWLKEQPPIATDPPPVDIVTEEPRGLIAAILDILKGFLK